VTRLFRRSTLGLLMIVLALAVPAVASGYYEDGHTRHPNGTNWSGICIQIWNLTTGAQGSTCSDSSGYYKFTNLVAGYRYSEDANVCVVGNPTWYDVSYDWTQPGNSFTHNLTLQPVANICN
jgi:hypothetical protein